jgi:hypothetical protein
MEVFHALPEVIPCEDTLPDVEGATNPKSFSFSRFIVWLLA